MLFDIETYNQVSLLFIIDYAHDLYIHQNQLLLINYYLYFSLLFLFVSLHFLALYLINTTFYELMINKKKKDINNH